MELLREIGKLFLLYARKAKRAVENHLTNGPGVVPPPPMKMPEVKPPKPEPDKYRLVPNGRGTYTLERYDKETEMYFCERVSVTPKEGAEAIAHIERDIIYYRILEEIGK